MGIHEVDLGDRAFERDLAAAVEVAETVVGGGGAGSENGGAGCGKAQRLDVHDPPRQFNRFGY